MTRMIGTRGMWRGRSRKASASVPTRGIAVMGPLETERDGPGGLLETQRYKAVYLKGALRD